jgi:arylsulfatase A-like enzyme
MTNVGHHDFRTPASWQKVRFEGVSNPQLEAYYNCLRYVDGVLRQLVDGYRELGLLEDTVFVFVGDHGQMFDEHNARQTYNAVYQEGLHVPALIYAPGMPLVPRVVKGARLQVDILPTIAELLGYRIEGAQLPGVSLLQPVAADRRLFFSSSIDWTFLAARRGSRKYIYSFDRKPMEVFDLERDPDEAHPLQIGKQELAQVRREMLEWRMQTTLSMMAKPVAGGEWTLAGNGRP